MKYHLQVNGKVVRANLTRANAFTLFDLLKECLPPDYEVSVICSKGLEVF